MDAVPNQDRNSRSLVSVYNGGSNLDKISEAVKHVRWHSLLRHSEKFMGVVLLMHNSVYKYFQQASGEWTSELSGVFNMNSRHSLAVLQTLWLMVFPSSA